MQFRILGPLGVESSGQPIPLGGPRQRALLAVLLVHAGEAVSSDRLVEELWGEDEGGGAAHALQTAVSRLRRVLGEEGSRLVARAPGYVLQVQPGELDAHRFEGLRAEGLLALSGGDGAKGSRLLGEALELWQGPALAEFSYQPFAQAEIARLEELRLATVEDRIEADLATGRHAEVTGELRSLIAEHPFRERLRAQLVLALYRSGRQAEALEEYRVARDTLVEELGIEPGPALQDLEARVLRQDPGLLPPGAVPLPTQAAVPSSEPAPALPGAAPPPVVREAPSLPLETRRTVTALFCDLADSTLLTERLDPEAMRLVLGRYFDVAADCFHSHGGTVEKFIGDAVVAIFGLPVLHEDDALRAVRAAVELRDALPALNAELDRDFGVTLDLRIGVNSGEVVAGEASPGQALVTGDPVNTAARLQQMAERGEILLGEATYALVPGAVTAEPLPDLTLKGKAQVVRARRLVTLDPTAPSFPRRLDAPLVGRTGELAQLRGALDRAVKERTTVLFTILGPPGIGKTRLAQEFASFVGDEAAVLTGRCLPYGEGITYWPLRELLHQAFGEDVRSEVTAVLGNDPDAGAIADRVASAVGLGEGAFPKEELAWATRRALEALARSGPLMVVLEDLHWAEPTFLELVEHVTSLATDAPILVVGVARPELVEDRPGWGGGLPNASSVLLEPLGEDEARALVENLDPGADAERVVDIAEGNPLFLEQIAAARAEAPDGEDLPVPPTIRALLAARLERLGPGERAVLERASVIGKEFYTAALRDLLPSEAASTLPRHLEALVRRRYIRPAPSSLGGEATYQFRHILIRDAAYQSLPKAARADLHERFADWIEGSLGDRVEEYEEILGYHLEQAASHLSNIRPAVGSMEAIGERAANHLANCGMRARQRGDPRAAASLLDRASRLLPREHARRREILLDLSDARHAIGELEGARAAIDDALQVAHETQDSRLEWNAKLEACILSLSADPEGAAEQAIRVAQTAIPILEALGDEKGLALAWATMGNAHSMRAQEGARLRAAEECIKHVRAAGLLPAGVTGLASAIFLGPTPVDDAIRRYGEFMQEVGEFRLVRANIIWLLGGLQGMKGDFDQARSSFGRARAIFDNLGVPNAPGEELPGYVEMLAGDPVAAEEAWRSAMVIRQRTGARGVFSTLAAYVAHALCSQGKYEEAAMHVRISREAGASDDIANQVLCRTATAKVRTAEGALEEAVQLAREAVALALAADSLTLRGDAFLDLAGVLREAGDTVAAASAAEKALAEYGRKGNTVMTIRAGGFIQGLAPTSL
jgi:class 3 adenylate cyclase/DNA-binding SARP family transcriptional activator/tetratricopeptide (TPR) repeat protein